jgi:hypothetical protein
MMRALDGPFEELADEVLSATKDDGRGEKPESSFTTSDREFLKQCFTAISAGIGNALSDVQQKVLTFEEENKHFKSRLDRMERSSQIQMDPAIERRIDKIEAILRTPYIPFSGLIHDSKLDCQAQCLNTGSEVVSDACLRQLGEQLQSKLDKLKLVHGPDSDQLVQIGKDNFQVASKSSCVTLGCSGDPHNSKPQPTPDEDENGCFVDKSIPCLQHSSKQLEPSHDRLRLADQVRADLVVQRRMDDIKSKPRTSASPLPANLGGLNGAQPSQWQAHHRNTQRKLTFPVVSAPQSCLQELTKPSEPRVDKMKQDNQTRMAAAIQRITDEIRANDSASLPPCSFWDPRDSSSQRQVQHPTADKVDTNPSLLVDVSKTTSNFLVEKVRLCIDQAIEEPRNPPARSRKSRTKGGCGGSTRTMMICNIPCRVTHANLVEAINSIGFDGTFEFVRLPSKVGQPHSNLGYGFVEFFSQADANRFARAFEGYRFSGRESPKACTVKVADRQGHIGSRIDDKSRQKCILK